MVLTETWCNESISSAILQIPGFNIDDSLRIDRTDIVNGIGGGIIVYVRNGLTVLSNDKINYSYNQYCSFDILKSDSESLNTIAAYRSPNTTNENTEKLCKIAKNMSGNSILIGDINLPKINWKLQTSDRKSQSFLEAAQENFLVQMIDFPTHFKGNILDLVLTNNPEKVASIIDVGPVGKSDHTGIMVEFYHEKTINKTDQLVHDWSNADIQGLRNEMMLTDWDTTMQDLDVDDSWRFFTQK